MYPAVHNHGGQCLLVSSRSAASVHDILARLDLTSAFTLVAGGLFGEAKGELLRRHNAHLYVGDHPGDVRGARSAQAVAVAVATGPTSADELRAAGADWVLATLHEFPAALDAWVHARAP